MGIDLAKLALIRIEPLSARFSGLPAAVAVGYMDGRTVAWHLCPTPPGPDPEADAVSAGYSLRERYGRLHRQSAGEVAAELSQAISGYTLLAEDEIGAAWRLGHLYRAGGLPDDAVEIENLFEVLDGIGGNDHWRQQLDVEAALTRLRPYETAAYEVSRGIDLIRAIANL